MSDMVCVLFSLVLMLSDLNKENVFDKLWFSDSTWTDFHTEFWLPANRSHLCLSACIYVNAHDEPAKSISYRDKYTLIDAQ